MVSPAANTRQLSSADIKPRQRVSVSTIPAVVRFGGKLAESAAHALSALGVAPWRVTLDRVEDIASGDEEEAGSWFRIESCHGSMTLNLALDRTAISALCEAAMGGTGTEAPYELAERPLSGIERDLLRLALSGLEARTAEVLSEQLATPVSRFDGVVGPDDSSRGGERIVFYLIANLFGFSGELRLTASRSEIAAQFGPPGSESGEFETQDEERAGLQRRIGGADIMFSVSLRPEAVLVEDVAALAPGRLLRLSATAQSPVIVSSEGNPVFTATLARSGDRLAIRVLAPVE